MNGRSTAAGQRSFDSAGDQGALVKAASRGFTVLLLGGVVQPLVAAAFAPLGFVWLPIVAVGAFTWAGMLSTRAAGSSPVHGAGAAFASYALVLPVVWMATGALDPVQTTATAATACAVGLVAAWVRLRHVAGTRRE